MMGARSQSHALLIDAARQMFGEAKGRPLASATIKERVIWPPGSFLSLALGEVVAVIRRGDTAHTSVAAAETDRQGIPVARTARRITAEPVAGLRHQVAGARVQDGVACGACATLRVARGAGQPGADLGLGSAWRQWGHSNAQLRAR